MYLVWFFIIFFFVTLYGSKNGCRPVFSQKFFGFVSFASRRKLPDSIKRGVFFVFFIFRFSFISKFGSFINYPVIKFSNMWQSASLNTSFRPGTLYNPNYNSSVQGVGTNQLPHDVFTSKPGVGPVDLGLEAKSDALASSGRRAMGMSPRGIQKKDIFSIGSEGDMYSLSSTSKLGRNLFENSMTQREAKVFGGNPPGSDAGKANAARHENLKDYMCKPLIGTFGVPLTDGDYNEDFARLPAKFSPASRTVRKSCADFASRHPNGRPFSNVILSVPPQMTSHDSSDHHYDKSYNTSHGSGRKVAHRSVGGRYFRGSDVTGDTIMNTRDTSINDRNFFDLGCKARTLNGGGYSKKIKEREDALLGQRGRLKRVDTIPDDIMEATKAALGKKQHHMVNDDIFNPRQEQDNSAYVTPTSEWKSNSQYANENAKTRLMETQKSMMNAHVNEANFRASLFRR